MTTKQIGRPNPKVAGERTAAHPDDDAIERYCLEGLRGKALVEVEKHLLLCPSCRRRVDSSRRFIHAMRTAATELSSVPLNFTHDTEDGPIHLFVRPAEGGGWLAALEPVGGFDTVEAANRMLLRAFQRAYPDHLCTGCGPGRPRTGSRR